MIKEQLIKDVIKSHSKDTGFANLIELVKKGQNTENLPSPRFSVRDNNNKIVDIAIGFSQDGSKVLVYKENRGSRVLLTQFPLSEFIPDKVSTPKEEAKSEVKPAKKEATTTTTTTKKVVRRRRTTKKATDK